MTGRYKLVCDGRLEFDSNSLQRIKEIADETAWYDFHQIIFKGATAYQSRECGFSDWGATGGYKIDTVLAK